jgi:hypothetical protein
MRNTSRIYFFFIVCFFIYPKYVFGCDLEGFQLGMNINEISVPNTIMRIDTSIPHQDIPLPSDDLCIDKPSIKGGVINLIIYFNTLVQIKIENKNSNFKIRDWAEKEYGAIDQNIKSLKNYQYLWEKIDVTVIYSLESLNNKRNEFIEITSNKNYHLIVKYYDQLELGNNENN